MTYSNALPIQFWPVAESTFNELEVCGITPVCWCQPIQMDDPILIQISSGAGETFSINVFDENDVEVAAAGMSEIASGLYEAAVPAFPAEGRYQVKIFGYDEGASPDDPGTAILKSDCLDVRTTHDCTNLITYRNNTNFAGLNYASASPETTFSVRVRSVFFHEEPFDESEDHELSSDTMVQIWAKLEQKKLFEVDFVPPYFHKKLRLIFAHQQFEVNDDEWIKKKNDAYTKIPNSNKHYPLNKASVLLTDKNFIKRNLL